MPLVLPQKTATDGGNGNGGGDSEAVTAGCCSCCCGGGGGALLAAAAACIFSFAFCWKLCSCLRYCCWSIGLLSSFNWSGLS